MPDEPLDQEARLSEFEVVPGQLARPGQPTLPVMVRVFDATAEGLGRIRIVIESTGGEVSHQLVVDADELVKRIADPQELDEP